MRVCVFCGSHSGRRPVYRAAARDVAALLAERGIGLIYGGGHVGLMGELADAALAAGGEVIGVIPQSMVRIELAHPALSRLIVVQSMHERKARMAELADAFLALPGGFGTVEEFFEIVTWRQLEYHHKPIGLLNVEGYFDPIIDWLERAVGEEFLSEENRRLIAVAREPAAMVDRLCGIAA